MLNPMQTMKTCSILMVVFGLLFCSGTTAGGESGFYWRAGAGYVYMPEAHWKDAYAEGTVSYGGGPGLSLAGGVAPGMVPVRVELEILYQANEIDKISSAQPVIAPSDWANAYLWAAMFNAYVEFRSLSGFAPYLMGGAGCGWYGIVLEDDNGGGSNSLPVFQGGIGVLYDAQRHVPGHYRISLDIGYRFTWSGNPQIDEVAGGNYETEFQSHILMIGAQF